MEKSSSKEIRVRLGERTEHFTPSRSYSDFIAQLKAMFALSSPSFKLYYKDPEGDQITVNTQEDFDLAFDSDSSCSGPLEFFIVAPEEKNKDSLLSLGKVTDPLKNVVSSYVVPEDTVKKPEAKAVYPMFSRVFPEPVAAPPAVPVTGPVETKRPEEKKAPIVAPTAAGEEGPCVACEGRKVGKKGGMCKKCNGTGKMSLALIKHIQKVAQREASRVLQEESTKQSNLLAQSKRLDDIMQSLGQSVRIEKAVQCSVCKQTVESGEAVFFCPLCPGTYLCEACEDTKGHDHALVKARVAGERRDLKMRLESEERMVKAVLPGEEFFKLWHVANSGRKDWPADTAVVQCSGEDLGMSRFPVGSLRVGNSVDIIPQMRAPRKSGHYTATFQIEAAGKPLIGPKLSAEVTVKEPASAPRKVPAPISAPVSRPGPPVQPVPPPAREEVKAAPGKGLDTDPKPESITKLYEKMKKRKVFTSHDMELNFLAIMQLGEFDPSEVVRQLINHANNVEETIAALIPDMGK